MDLDLKGKIAVYIAGTPASITGATCRALSAGGRPLAGVEGGRRDRQHRHSQPEDHRTAMGADRAQPPEPGDDARRSALQRSRGHAGGCDGEPGQRRAAVRRIRPHAGGTASRSPTRGSRCRGSPCRSSFRARVALESQALQSDNIVGGAARKRSGARPRTRRADRAPRSRRHRRPDQRRPRSTTAPWTMPPASPR